MIWKEKDDQQLKKLISERYSLAEISRKMGITRGSVSGRRNRLGLRLTSRSFSHQKARPSDNVGNGITVADRIVAKAKFKKEHKTIAQKEELFDDNCPPSLNVPFLDNFGCNDITNQSENTCCGHPRIPGKSYCNYHQKLYSMGLPQRRRNANQNYPR